jgi:HD superfamily phosphodiesterase
MKPWQKKLIKIVSPLLKKLEPDHGAAHSRVVFWWCLRLTEDYQRVDKGLLFAAAWLHDIGHLKLKGGIENKGRNHSDSSASLAGPILKKAGFS